MLHIMYHKVILSLLQLASPCILETDKMVIVKEPTVKFPDCCKVLRERNIFSEKQKRSSAFRYLNIFLILYYIERRNYHF